MAMNQAREIVQVHSHSVSCDGSQGIRSTGSYAPSALGHPRIYLEIDERGFADCPYCDKRFLLHAPDPHEPTSAGSAHR